MKNLIGKHLDIYKDYLVIVKGNYPDLPVCKFAFVAFITEMDKWAITVPNDRMDGDFTYVELDPRNILEIYDIEEVREANEYKA